MDFRVLGPLEAVDGDEPIDLGPRKQRALLALLVINAGKLVSTDQIFEALWGDDLHDKENALWVYISRLRRALEPDREQRGASSILVTRDHGYVLTTDQVDSKRFEAIVSAQRSTSSEAGAASSALREALDMWRGAPFEEFTYDEFAQPEIKRLTEIRLGAIEMRIDADLLCGLSSELIAELEALRESHPLREKIVFQLMLAMYRAGRAADALRTYERFRRILGEEMGMDPTPELARLFEQILLHDPRLQPLKASGPEPQMERPVTNPYQGLRPFGEEDHSRFFGREELVADVARRLEDGVPLIALIGPSGSGKSSIVRGGLIPSLRKGASTGSDRWLVLDIVPGAHPFSELAAALRRAKLDRGEPRSAPLEDDPIAVLEEVLALLPDPDRKLALVIDQFEELYTLVDPSTRDRFLSSLIPLIDDRHGRIAVILTLRADFYGECLTHAGFGSRLGLGVVNVVPMQPSELETAAERPAHIAGVELERALVVTLLNDVIGRPGSLPMFQHVLTELFDRRKGDLLTLADYEAIGGVKGALTRRADDLYLGLSEKEQEVARQLFLRLVTVTRGGEWVRRRVRGSEISSLEVDVEALHRVIETYTNHRLLTHDRAAATGAPTVEVAHEALLTEWGRLSGWIEDTRDGLKRRSALVAARMEWVEAGKDPGYLLTGSRLHGYEVWASTTSLRLTTAERAYLQSSLRVRHEAAAIEQARVNLQMRTARSARRRLWGLMAMIGSTLFGLTATFWAVAATDHPTVAVVYQGRGQGAVANLVASGADRASAELGVDVIEVTPPFTDPRGALMNLGEQGVDLVIINGFDLVPYSADLPSLWPDTVWRVNDSYVEGMSNTAYAHQEGAYLAGVVAAMASETKTIGFVGGFQTPGIEDFRAGYEAGARSVNPEVNVLSMYASADTSVGGFQRPDLGEQAAENLFGRGADVVFHAAGQTGDGVLKATQQASVATDRHLWAIGVDSNQYFDVPEAQRPHVLASVTKRFDLAIYEMIRSFVEGEATPEFELLGLADAYLDLSDAGGTLDPTIREKVDENKAAIVAGEIEVPYAPRSKPLPPPGVERADKMVAIRILDDTCAIDGADTAAQGEIVTVDVSNATDEVAFVTVGFGGSGDIAAIMPVAPGGSNRSWIEARTGKPMVLLCGSDLSTEPTELGRVEIVSP